MAKAHSDLPSQLPEQPVSRWVGPFARFLHVEAAGGAVLVGATAIALVLANSPLADAYLAIWKTKLTIGIGDFVLSHSLKHWISDALMAVFFFVIGLEVKRELVMGELRELSKAALPIAAALGGMVVPAGIYLGLLWGEPAARGWGIPMATDIAFVVGCMAVLGSRVPPGLRVLLISLAIADDIGAILVIAIGYTESIALGWLGVGVGAIGVVYLMQQADVRSVPLYALVGAVVWLGFHESGVHATIAGVILGVMTPHKRWVGFRRLEEVVDRSAVYLRGESETSKGDQQILLRDMELAAREATSPLERLETLLHPWQAFAIVPLFALANAGVTLSPDALHEPVALVVAIALAAGKPIGIFGASWLAVKLGLARLPDGVSWGAVLGGGMLAGIGFTMSLFIGGLAFRGLDPVLTEAAKFGILIGSLASAVLGMALLFRILPQAPPAPRA
jgi:NhaA family Na+:H+ antiporter